MQNRILIVSALFIFFLSVAASSQIIEKNYNKVCNEDESDTTYHCNRALKLQCISGTCRCETSTVENYVYVWDGVAGTCILKKEAFIPDYHKCAQIYHQQKGYNNATQKRICKLDSQCQQQSPYTHGEYSICNLESCSCQCLSETIVAGVEYKVRNINDKCVLDKKLGDSCFQSEECKLTIEGDDDDSVICNSTQYICTCEPNRSLQIGNKCYRRVSTLYKEACKFNEQCPADSISICNQETHVCSCTNGTRPIQNKCYKIKNYGQACDVDEECWVGAGNNVECKKNLTSSTSRMKICSCKNESLDFIWSSAQQQCVPIANVLGEPCLINSQCTSRLGTLSRCNANGICECFDTINNSNNNKNVGYDKLNNKCIYTKSLNVPCTSNIECTLSDSNLVCTLVFSNNNSSSFEKSQVCKCRAGTFWTNGKCLEIGSYASSCSYDSQCQHEEALGELSACIFYKATNNGFCLCNDTTLVGEYNGKCYLKKRLGQECEFDEECFIGENVNDVFCDSTPTNINEDTNEFNNSSSTRVCSCKEIRNNGTSSRSPICSQKLTETEQMDWILPIVIIACILILTILVTGLIVGYLNWKKLKKINQIELQRFKQPLLLKNLAEFEINEDDFVLDKECILGSGRNGIVYRGYFKPKSIHVAIKTNQDCISTSELYLKSIFEEAKVLIHLGGHHNVIRLFGICQASITKGNVYLLTELCSIGSLESFLRTKRFLFEFHDSSSNDSSSTRNSTTSIEDRSDYRMSRVFDSTTTANNNRIQIGQLYSWVYQIADGMEFISSKKVIHSDLATRNILLANLNSIKLTDFGLSRRLYESYTYHKTNPDPLPWKWLDYDALRFMIFTRATDVWSFGITIWEIFTLGQVPYPGFITPWSNNFMQKLLEGLHPNKPTYASDELYSLMKKCWNVNKQDRPDFTCLKQHLLIMSKRYSLRKAENDEEELDGFGYLLPLTN